VPVGNADIDDNSVAKADGGILDNTIISDASEPDDDELAGFVIPCRLLGVCELVKDKEGVLVEVGELDDAPEDEPDADDEVEDLFFSAMEVD